MKNYSNFINGFISSYEIKDGEILIHTPFIKKNEPIRKTLTKENIEKIEGRLENQYNMIIKNQEEIIKFNNRKILPLVIFLIVAGASITAMSFILYGTTFISRIVLGSYLASFIMGGYIKDKKDKKFRHELKDYLKYINNRDKIEVFAEKDKNVTAYLNEDTLSKIEENEKLKQQGTIDSVYNIDLMDKMSLKELKKLLLRYRLSESLEEEQNFRIPEQKTVFKVRKLEKESSNK